MTRRIVVMGSSCAGKTTVAERLAAHHGVPHVELDALHHGPSWRAATAEELRARLDGAIAGQESWVVDGNYMGKLGTYLIDQADTIVWLDLPLPTLLARMWGRTAARIRDRTELWAAGNHESWRKFLLEWDGLLWYTLRNHHRRRFGWPRRFEGRRVVRLRTQRQVDAWLAAETGRAPEVS